MNFILLGISHKTAPVEIRERYTFSRKKIPETLIKFSQNKLISESVILLTCNRTEFYTVKNYPVETREFLLNELGVTDDDLQYFYFLKDKDAVYHLFRVAAGLESQVIGENQILGQVKSAYLQAKDLGMTKRYFNRLFPKAIEIGKLIRQNTKISEGNISVVSVALKMIENIYGTLKGKKILIIGTGKTGELVAKYLYERGIQAVFIANRTYEKALELARRIDGRAIRFDSLKNEIKDSDIVISATSSPHLILKREDILDVVSHKLIILDLALPRDIDPEIKNIPNIVLFNLDDINLIIEENYKKRILEAKKAERIVEEEVEKFCQCLEPLKLEPEEALLP